MNGFVFQIHSITPAPPAPNEMEVPFEEFFRSVSERQRFHRFS